MKGKYVIFSYWVGDVVTHPMKFSEAYAIKDSRRINSMVYDDATVINVDLIEKFKKDYADQKKRDIKEGDFYGE